MTFFINHFTDSVCRHFPRCTGATRRHQRVRPLHCILIRQIFLIAVEAKCRWKAVFWGLWTHSNACLRHLTNIPLLFNTKCHLSVKPEDTRMSWFHSDVDAVFKSRVGRQQTASGADNEKLLQHVATSWTCAAAEEMTQLFASLNADRLLMCSWAWNILLSLLKEVK